MTAERGFQYGSSNGHPGGEVLPFPRPTGPMPRPDTPLFGVVEHLEPPSPDEIAARKLAALKIVEDSLGIGGYDEQIDRLLTDIRSQAEAVRNYRQAVKTAQDALATTETELALPINANKVQYPNDAARKSAIEKAKATDPAYQSALRALQDAQNALDTAQLDLDDLERRLSAVKGARSYAAERLRLVASV